MTMRKIVGALVLCLVVALGLNVAVAKAQSEQGTAQQAVAASDETNLDTQLYLIVGSDRDVPDSRLPTALDGVVKQLRSALPYRNYRLAATVMNRVKNEGRLNLRWLGGPFATAASSSVTPSFSEFRVRTVKLVRNTEGQPIVQMINFTFGARIPIQTGTAIASNGPAAPVINYENTGLDTDISMREGEPVIVGTLNIGPSGDAIILVVSAKRTSK
ncbi:MAG: hypothetical protein C5B55_01635 [Blastocatellia bacterium]|nr:MAG: hypothetical protein C5B55_01635 [Blastocatellia bacterium]